MKVKVIACTNTWLENAVFAERLLEYAGRVCYQTEHKDSNPEKFLEARIRQGHESLIEHASMTFEIEGISRACSHQLVRHRIASYSQQSQRYVDMKDPVWIVPRSVADSPAAMCVFMGFLEDVDKAYRRLRELGVPKEDARYVLPNAAATKLVMTMNFRALRTFFKTRCDKAAQWEIRGLANEMLRLAYATAPAVYRDLHEEYVNYES